MCAAGFERAFCILSRAFLLTRAISWSQVDDMQVDDVQIDGVDDDHPAPDLKHSPNKMEQKKLSLEGAADAAYSSFFLPPPAESPLSSNALCSGVRKALLVRAVASAVEQAHSMIFSELQLLLMQIAMLFESTAAFSEHVVKDRTASIDHFSQYAAKVAMSSGAQHAVTMCVDALQNMHGKPGSSIQLVFEVTHDLDLMCCAPDAQSLQRTFDSHAQTLPQCDFHALVQRAEDAIRATGDRLMVCDYPCVVQQHSYLEGAFKLCSTKPTICVPVVQKALLLREHVAKRLDQALPGMADFQKKVEIATMDEVFVGLADEIQRDLGDPSSKWAKDPQQVSNQWVKSKIGGAQQNVLTSLSAPDKAALVKDGMQKLLKNPNGADEPDEAQDEKALEVVKAQLLAHQKYNKVTITDDKPSQAWEELATSKFTHSEWLHRRPGEKGFNVFAQEMMMKHSVPDTRSVSAPGLSKAPTVQPYQQVPAYLVHPKSYSLGGKGMEYSSPRLGAADPSQRLLVCHRTGAGKTCTMIRIADSYFSDRRPKILLFPTPAVCSNFYMELLNPRFPNRYAEYLQREDKLDEVRKGLELGKGALRCGRVVPEFLHDRLRPSAPLRAFSYTQAGGRQSIGDKGKINAVFKCPDGYAGEWMYRPGIWVDEDGYDDYKSDGNPFSNKIILMDEVHNLVKPSADIRKSAKRMLMLDMLKHMLLTCKNSVLVGFTATPLDEEGSSRALLDIIKGAGNETRLDEGYVSYFMGSPSPAFPVVRPSIDWITNASAHSGSLNDLIRRVELKNFADSNKGNLAEYYRYSADEVRALQRCSVGQYFATAGKVELFQVLVGGGSSLIGEKMPPKLCGEEFFDEEPGEKEGYCRDRVEGFCSKLAAVCDDVDTSKKTVVLIHSHHGFKLMLRLLQARFPGEVLGYIGSTPSAMKSWDDEIKELVGEKHNEAKKAMGTCPCHICRFNALSNVRGGDARILVADARFCSEGCAAL